MLISESFKYEEIIGFKFGSSHIGKPKMFSHIYFIDGLLIDTGHSKMRKIILSETRKLDIDQILITHHHEDHSGNIYPIQIQHNCPVYASPKCCEIMKNPPLISFAQKNTWGKRPPYHDLIAIHNEIKTDQYNFQIISIPGHAIDMVALYEPNKKWLFSADLYVNAYIGYFLYNESVKQQIESIERILQFDFKVMLCSHNPQFNNAKEKLKKKLNFLTSFYEDVSLRHMNGLKASEIYKDLKLKENRMVKFLSGGKLSKMNMVKAVIRDIENG